MKTCLVCGAIALAEEPTCASCGCADWKPDKPDEGKPETPSAPAEKPRRKKDN